MRILRHYHHCVRALVLLPLWLWNRSGICSGTIENNALAYSYYKRNVLFRCAFCPVTKGTDNGDFIVVVFFVAEYVGILFDNPHNTQSFSIKNYFALLRNSFLIYGAIALTQFTREHKTISKQHET